MTTEQELLTWPLTEVRFLVDYSYYNDKEPERRVERLLLPPPLPELGIKKGTHFNNLMSAIENSSGFSQQVLKDLYRNVALGHFTTINPTGLGNKASILWAYKVDWLRKEYPNQDTLPGFVNNLSAKTTFCGLLVYNLLKQKNQDDPGYRMVGAVLRTYREKEACPKKKGEGNKSEYLIELELHQILKSK